MRGQVIDRGKDRRGRKRWLLRVYLGTDPATGKQRYKSRMVYGTKAAAEAELAKWIAQIEQGLVVEPSRMTLGAYLERWLEAVKPSLSPTTVAKYGDDVERIKRHLGYVPLAKLTPMHVQDLYRALLEDGLAPRSVLHTHRVLHRALNVAVKWRLVPYNVCDAAEPPRPDRFEPRLLAPEELSRLLDAARGTAAYIPIVLAAAAGLRRGEVLGLEWPDVDLDGGTLAVRRTVVEAKGKLFVKEPKSRAGLRAVPLPPLAVAALREWRAEQARLRLQLGEAWQGGERVCTGPDGRPLTPAALTHAFKQAAKRAGIEGRLRFHDLRHGYTTLLARQGVHPKVAAALLGHSSTAVTLEIYSHVTDDMKREAVERLAAVLPRARGATQIPTRYQNGA